jgi:predicted RNA binding protein YcfA (HicA-like mRNA interferase family)
LGRLRRFKPSEVIRILEEHGFKQARQTGSHVQMRGMREDGAVTVPVPLHGGVLPIGTLASIVRQSGLPRELFEEED